MFVVLFSVKYINVFIQTGPQVQFVSQLDLQREELKEETQGSGTNTSSLTAKLNSCSIPPPPPHPDSPESKFISIRIFKNVSHAWDYVS